MSRTKVYITPFDADGEYAEEIDVTKYVESLGSVGIDTDSSDYNIGVYRNSSVRIDLNNRRGLFSDISIYQSIFRYTRSDAKVRITFLESDELPYCGTAICGEALLVEEVTVFQGLLSDDSLTEEAGREVVSFIALGYESLFSRVEVPFADLSVGNTIKQILVACLDQEVITDLLTIDAANINPAVNLASDDISDLENQTAKQVIDDLLLLSNSVLYIQDETVFVKSRGATPDVMGTFYGQSSSAGRENIANMKNVTNGKNRVFNYMTWSQSTAAFQNSASVRLHGVRKKELSSKLFTDNLKQLAIMTGLVTEFRFPKQEMELVAPLTTENIELQILDRVVIDYPTVYVPGDFDLPICGVAICGDVETATLPRGLWSLQIPSDRRFKIIKKTLDFKAMVATFKLREI